ncbi:MAG: LTA synthase family protein [Sarcina sp.]
MEKAKRILRENKAFYAIKNFFVLLISSLVVVLVIEFMQRGSIFKVFNFVTYHPSLFILNIAIVMGLTSICFLFKKTKAVYTIITGIILILASGAGLVMKFRGSPVTVADMYSLRDGFAIAKGYLGGKEMILIVIVLLAFISGIVFMFKKEKVNKKFSYKYNLTCILLPVLIVLFSAYKYNIDNKKIILYRWDLTGTYNINGLLVSFIDSAKELIPKKPETYSKERIDLVKNKLDEETKAVAATTKKPNVIVVQLESFLDPYRLKGVEFKEDPIPNIRKLQEQGPQGKIEVPCFGGGTVRTEFEVLTGYSANNLGPGEIPNNTILRKEPIESMAYILKKQGYDVTAIHNYLGNFYNRDEVYANFGFDSLVTQEYIDNLQYTYDYPSDMNNLGSIEELIKKDEPQFIFNVAVESHGPYSVDYTPTEGREYTVSGDITQEERNQIQEYVDKATEVDKYVKSLIEYVEKSKEPTVIAMYSDHLPALKAIDNAKNYPQDEKYQTEYFIWSNTGIKPEKQDIKAYQLSTYVLNLAGVDAGLMPTFHKTYSTEVNYGEYLRDVQFDQIYGEKYLTGKNPYEKTTLELGLNPIKITKAYIEGNNLIVEGENFTKASKVIVKGKPVQTTYDNANRIVATGVKSNLKEISVGQEGMYGKMLSKTADFKIQ